MFYGSSNGIDIPNLHLYFFRNLNEETKTLSKSLFGAYVEKSNALIIIGENNNQSTVFGYFIIRGINITHSPYFEYLRSNTVAFGGEDCTEEFYHIKCYKIVDWAIDSVVKTNSNLLSVFNQIAVICASVNKVVIIWMEHGNELKFYPIKAMSDLRMINQSFARYFTDYMLSL